MKIRLVILRMARILLILFSAQVSLACAADRPPAKAPPIMVAANVAYIDFSARIRKTPGEGKLATYLRDIKHYEMRLREESNFYVIAFIPIDPKNDGIFGGAAEYQIRKTDFRILKIVNEA